LPGIDLKAGSMLLRSVRHSEIASNRIAFRDLPFSDLPGETRNRLAASREQNWFSSMIFAESYSFPPGDRVSWLENGAGEVLERCFYRESKWAGLFKQLQMCGPIDLRSDLVHELQRQRRASMIHVPWVAASDLPGWKSTWRSRAAKRIGEDYCIALPTTPSEYLKSLGSKTRKHLPYYVRRLQREWGEQWTFERHYRAAISRQSYESLLDLNRCRMDQKGRKTAWTADLREHRWKAVKDCGLLCSLVYKGRIVAGTFSLVHANEAYLVVIAHDPQFDELNIGSVSLWLTIEHLIRAAYRRYHLMWGHSFYKQQFGGDLKPLYRLTIFANLPVAVAWHAADFILVPKMWRFAAKMWRRLSWNLSLDRSSRAEDSNPLKEVLADGAPPRMERN
jgi:Acetyltransferase (GNAT) domain